VIADEDRVPQVERVNLTILGCRAAMPADGQASSGYLVRTGSATVLLDCGPGIATTLSAVATPDQLTAVFVSHLHLDHCYDLLPLGKSLLSPHIRYPGVGAEAQDAVDVDPVPLYVPAGAAERLAQLAAIFPVTTLPVLNRVFELAYDVREYRPGETIAVGDAEITLHELRHSATNCGVRIECAEGSLAYTGDTGMTSALLDLAADVDLLLAEASLLTTDHGPHGHLSATDAAQVAATAGAKSLVLTHFPMADPAWLFTRRDEARAIFSGDVHLAQPGQTFDIVAALKGTS
jgi:ribonuclease BN (tRNA processing enzyme)